MLHASVLIFSAQLLNAYSSGIQLKPCCPRTGTNDQCQGWWHLAVWVLNLSFCVDRVIPTHCGEKPACLTYQIKWDTGAKRLVFRLPKNSSWILSQSLIWDCSSWRWANSRELSSSCICHIQPLCFSSQISRVISMLTVSSMWERITLFSLF